MKCDEARLLMMGYLDNELTEDEIKALQEHLNSCAKCRAEWESFKELKKETSEMKFKPFPEMFWDDYWENVYNRIERGIGWILFSLGAIILLAFGAYELLEDFFLNPKEPMIEKIGVGLLILGLIVIFVSVLREKLMIRKVDKYRRVLR